MSKAEKIRSLIDQGLSNAEIAEQLDCSVDYARATRGRYLRPEVSKAWVEAYLKSDEGREYNRRKTERWRKKNPERWREINSKSYYKRKTVLA